jgi:hypothetical protein
MITEAQRRQVSRPIDERVADVAVKETWLPNRMSWGAVVGGVVIALVVQIGLNMLGLSIGANTVDPLTESTPIDPSLGMGAVIWTAASMLIAFFLGGWVSARLSASTDKTESALHGIVVWAVVTLLTLWLVTSAVGTVVSGIGNAVGAGLNLAGQNADEAVPAVADALERQDIFFQSISEELNALRPVPAADGTAAGQNGAAADTEPTSVERDVLLSARQLLTADPAAVTDTERQPVIDALTRAGMSPEQAQQRVADWEQNFASIRTQVEEVTRQAAQTTADGIAALSGVVFAALVIGAFAAAAGGLAGWHQPVVVQRTTVVRD